MLKPQDIVILLKIVTLELRTGDFFTFNSQVKAPWTYSSLANELFISPSEVHAGIKRASKAGLLNIRNRRPVIKALEELLIHGVKYVFPPIRGAMTRGMVTSFAGPPLADKFMHSDEPPPVWPSPDGKTRGLEFSPLYKTVPQAASLDQFFYEMLVLVDAIRDGRTRESAWAIKELKYRLAMDGSTIR